MPRFQAIQLNIAILSLLLLISACAVPGSTTATPSPSALITSTAAPSVVPSITSVPTYTTAPTLPLDEAKAFAADLLINNAGCSLPCWWGFIPGETPWETIRDVLGQLDSNLYVVQIDESLFFAIPKIPVPTELVSTYPSYIY